MAKFDIIAAASNAYKTSWRERHYLLRLAAIPFAIKLVCFVLAATFVGNGENYLRFMLIMVPGYLAEGWMLAHFTRLLVLGHRWPFQASGDFDADMAVLTVRARGVLSGMIVFVLVNMVIGLFMAIVGEYMMDYMPTDGGQAPEVPGHIALLSFFMLGLMFWGFRLLWLYIPFAVNMNPMTYLRTMRGATSSIYMIAVWLVCFVPVFLVLRIIAGVLGGFAEAAFGSAAATFVFMMLTVVADTIKSLLITAGITYGLMEIFGKGNKA
jgi:hypothetical protein